jgi:hypothetical protein
MKNIKNLLIAFFVLISLSFYAQGKRFEEKKDKIKSLKIAFLTTELNLNPDEAAKFWPIYNAFEENQFELRRQKMKSFLKKEDNNLNKLTDKEASALLAKMESNEDEMRQLQKKLITNLKGVISPIKIIKLKKAEEDFNKKLLQQFRNKKRN